VGSRVSISVGKEASEYMGQCLDRVLKSEFYYTLHQSVIEVLDPGFATHY
jgi:hypothetical protein